MTPEGALKLAGQEAVDDRAEIIEGTVRRPCRPWAGTRIVRRIRRRIEPRVDELRCFTGSGNIDLPGSPNWYVPDLAVVPSAFVEADAVAVLPDQTLLIVEITSPSNGDDGRIIKRKRYAEYGAPLFLLVDRQAGTCTLFSEPSKLGYTHVEGPHPFGTPVRFPEPFGLEIDTTGF